MPLTALSIESGGSLLNHIQTFGSCGKRFVGQRARRRRLLTHTRVGLQESMVKNYTRQILLGLNYLHKQSVVSERYICVSVVPLSLFVSALTLVEGPSRCEVGQHSIARLWTRVEAIRFWLFANLWRPQNVQRYG